MSIRCKLFGHKLYTDYGKGNAYTTLEGHYTDGAGRVHVHVYGECDRCGKKFKVANAHITYDLSLEQMIQSFHDYYMRNAIRDALNALPPPAEEVEENDPVEVAPSISEPAETAEKAGDTDTADTPAAAPKKRGRKKKIT